MPALAGAARRRSRPPPRSPRAVARRMSPFIEWCPPLACPVCLSKVGAAARRLHPTGVRFRARATRMSAPTPELDAATERRIEQSRERRLRRQGRRERIVMLAVHASASWPARVALALIAEPARELRCRVAAAFVVALAVAARIEFSVGRRQRDADAARVRADAAAAADAATSRCSSRWRCVVSAPWRSCARVPPGPRAERRRRRLVLARPGARDRRLRRPDPRVGAPAGLRARVRRPGRRRRRHLHRPRRTSSLRRAGAQAAVASCGSASASTCC